MEKNYYIASCVFTKWHTALSRKIQEYVKNRFNMTPVRCCMENFKVEEYAEEMPKDYREEWLSLPNTFDLENAKNICTICHNCANLIGDKNSGINLISLWELILSDENFEYPDYKHEVMYIQDCWRANENQSEQIAVRKLLKKMNIDILELSDNFSGTDFCGRSFYKIGYIRKSRLAPKNHPLNKCPDSPIPSEDEQKVMMEDYCKRFTGYPVVCYCHYCLEGIQLGGATGHHLAKLLFSFPL